MQNLSFHFNNSVFKSGSLSFSVMIYSFSNAYSLDPAKIERIGETGKIYHCFGLLTNGGQTEAAGEANISLTETGTETRIKISASLHDYREEIRRVKLTIHGLDQGKIINLIDTSERNIDSSGVLLTYPEGWREVGTPLVILKNDDCRYTFLKSMDTTVREKNFAFSTNNNSLSVELISEQTATEMSNFYDVGEWVIGSSDNIDDIYKPHIRHIEQAYHLAPWNCRKDVPDWAREISLVAAIHGQHWTGYIFNDYNSILNIIRFLTEKIEGKRILVYLPGWEGRYYWKYGNYLPDERMGGSEGFYQLCSEAKKMGVHLMPMFGINIAGNNWDNFSEWGASSEIRSASGNIVQTSVDWDGSRHYDHGSNRALNPGAPKWQNRLTTQIIELSKEYGFNSVFLDIAAVWENDPNYNVYEGVKSLVQKLYANIPDLLVAGEGWYDALGASIPLLQCGHTDGKLHFHDEAYPAAFDTYCREFGHLCLGDPSRYSTGVHEQGSNSEWRVPLRKGIIPTLTIVDGTIANAPCKVDQIIEDAKEYARRFLF